MIHFLLIYFRVFSLVQNIDIIPVNISKTGRVRMDRNLGAQRPTLNSKDSIAFGDLFQWGRFKYVHQYPIGLTMLIL
jgi:hypothetical protein